MSRKSRTAAIAAIICLTAALLSSCGGKTPGETPGRTTAQATTADPHAGMVQVHSWTGGEIWVKLYEDVPVNPYDKDKFVRDGEAGSFTYYEDPAFKTFQCVDISEHNGDIDWEKVASSGVTHAYIRAGYRGWGSVGNIKTDSAFALNYSRAKEAGLKTGVYFYSQATNAEEAAQEAAYVLDLVKDSPPDLPVIFDWENMGDDEPSARTANVSGRTLTDCAKSFCETVKAAGLTPGIYYYRDLAYNAYILDELTEYFAWVSEPGDSPWFYYAFDMWQYTFEGKVDGIPGKVDLSLIFEAAFPEGDG